MELSGLQDSFGFRALGFARDIASHLILRTPKPSFPCYPMGTADDLITEQCAVFLDRWEKDPLFKKKIVKFSLPLYCHKAEDLIRATLSLPSGAVITDKDVQRAVICACLVPLRQTIGSCFATAPAIVIQKKRLDFLIDDLYDLLTTGQLKRVVEGREYTVPLSLNSNTCHLDKPIGAQYHSSPGIIAAFTLANKPIPKDLPSMSVKTLFTQQIPPEKLERALNLFTNMTETALLKAWEFTLASFSDIKMEFSQWNLSWGLGLNPEEAGGIGEALYENINEKLQKTNQKIEEAHKDVIVAHEQLKSSETLLRQANSTEQARQLQGEWKARLYHFQCCEDIEKKLQNEAKIYVDLFSFLLQQYTTLLQQYFQEIYDPQMADIFIESYEDLSAGFRLIYNHGRKDSTLWTAIYRQEEFINSLVEFFTVTERFLQDFYNNPIEKKNIETQVTGIIQHVRSSEFIQSALSRAAALNRTPWSYLSGGRMDDLIPIYFRSPTTIKKESQSIADELNLFIFLIDVLKTVSFKDILLLIQSPTHAFSLTPDTFPFREAWESNTFTYTWIRDNFLEPGKEFYEAMVISPNEQLELLRRLGLKRTPLTTTSVTNFIALIAEKTQSLPFFLHKALPLIRADQCKTVLHQLLGHDQFFLPKLPPFLLSSELQTLARLFSHPSQYTPLAEKARAMKLAPLTCVFADTNWSNSYFSFVINPCTLNLEMWRTDKTGVYGFPFPLLKSWLGEGKEFEWSVFI
jgi:hypothetical protein